MAVSNRLLAFDLGYTFDELWSMATPAKGWIRYLAVANHIIAWSTDTGRIWVLQP